ncbi:hypothetical protein M9Y10_044877 [Tritrichomonas musculus]|uniref:Uncharacterized protein n=1 Tax=Tritrichomonas musculus TaxID=1915356 RepID=A0ABR2JTM4_9EUKA
MLDEDSTRFLVCKKIAQLVKLINHLSTQVADKKHEIDFTTSEFDRNLNSLLKTQKNNFDNANMLIKQIEEDSGNSYKIKYQNDYEQIYSDYEKTLINCQSDLTEATVSITRNLSKITSYINSLDNELETQLKQLDESISQTKKQYSDQIKNLNQLYKDEVDTLDDESKEKLNLLQEQTSRKLDTLDKDFNRSLEDLKAKFGQTSSLSRLQIEKDDFIQTKQNDHKSLKKFINDTKEEITFLISTTKAVLKEQLLQKNKISESLKEMIENQKNELNKVQSSYDNNLKMIEEESQKTKEEHMNKQQKMDQELEDLQKSFLNLTKSDLEEIQEQHLLIQLSSRKSTESINTTLSDINKQIEDKEESLNQKQKENDQLFNQLNANTQNLLNEIQEKSEELSKLKEIHQKELLVLSKSQKSAINDLNSLFQKEIEQLKEKYIGKTEKNEFIKQVEENRNLYNSLCFEKAELLNNDKNFDDDEEISELKEKNENELKKLESELESELENINNEEKNLIDACSESHRNELFQINKDIAEKYDEHLQSIRDNFAKRDFREEDEKINSKYESELHELEKQYKKLEKSEIIIKPTEKVEDKEEIDSLIKEKNDKNEKIEKEKKLIIDGFLQQQKIEEGEYFRKMAEINYNSTLSQKIKSDQFEKAKEQYNERIQKLNNQIKEKETELKSLQNSILFIEKVTSDFDDDEKKLRDSLAELRATSDIKISKAIHIAELKKGEVIKKMENFQAKFKKIATMAKQHIDQSSIVLKDATEKTQEESKNLQQRVAHAISRLVKHFTKEKDKLNKKFNQKSEELKKSIEELKNETNQFVNDSLKKEEESRTVYEKDIQSNETDSNQKLELLRKENNKKTQELEDQYNQILNQINQFKLDIENHKSREEELAIIERLELQLTIKEKHIHDITDDISDCKKNIVKQEDVYNSHFGIQPSIAVFRPTTAVIPIPINLRLKQQQRPASAAVKMRPVTSFLKNKSKKNDIR